MKKRIDVTLSGKIAVVIMPRVDLATVLDALDGHIASMTGALSMSDTRINAMLDRDIRKAQRLLDLLVEEIKQARKDIGEEG